MSDMSEAEYRTALTQAHLVAEMASHIDDELLADAIAEAEHTDAFAPFFDPTAWLRKGTAMRQDMAVMRAVRDLKASLEKAAGVR